MLCEGVSGRPFMPLPSEAVAAITPQTPPIYTMRCDKGVFPKTLRPRANKSCHSFAPPLGRWPIFSSLPPAPAPGLPGSRQRVPLMRQDAVRLVPRCTVNSMQNLLEDHLLRPLGKPLVYLVRRSPVVHHAWLHPSRHACVHAPLHSEDSAQKSQLPDPQSMQQMSMNVPCLATINRHWYHKRLPCTQLRPNRTWTAQLFR